MDKERKIPGGKVVVVGGEGQTHMFLCCDLDGCLGSSGLISCLERSGPISVLVLISVRFFLQCVFLQ